MLAQQKAAEEEADEEAAARQEEKEEKERQAKEEEEACADDSNWHDADGDGCLIYDGFIADGKLTLDEACNYGEGDAKKYCRKTCGTCKAAAAFMDGQGCKDIECVSKWQEQVGTCFACSDWPNYCADPVFKHECPVTCGSCTPDEVELPPMPEPPTTTPALPDTTEDPFTVTVPPLCEDQECIESWRKETGKCFRCADYADDLCGRDREFEASCPLSCRLCVPGDEDNTNENCLDHFKMHTCERYKQDDLCHITHIAHHCQRTCGVCHEIKKIVDLTYGKDKKEEKHEEHSDARGLSAPAALLFTLLAVMLSR